MSTSTIRSRGPSPLSLFFQFSKLFPRNPKWAAPQSHIILFAFSRNPEINLPSVCVLILQVRMSPSLVFPFFFVPIIMIHYSTKNYSAATSKSCVRIHFLTKKLLCQTFATLLPLGLTLCHYWIRALKHNFYSFLWNSVSGKFTQNAQKSRAFQELGITMLWY